MIYTLTLNPSLDLITLIDGFKAGSLNRMQSELIVAGGKGINVSLVLKEFGIDSTVLGFIAGFTGNEIRRLLGSKELREDLIVLSEGMSRINVKVRGKEETEINGIGPAITSGDLDKLYSKLDLMESGDILIMSGSAPSSLPDTIYADIMEHVGSRGVSVIVDASGKLLTNTLAHNPFLIKPNRQESEAVTGIVIRSRSDAFEAAHALARAGARNVLISLGSDGAVLLSEDGNEFECDAPSGQAVNSVGAGDSLLAGFVAGLIKHNDLYEALRYGVASGSACAFSVELATKEKTEKLIFDI